MRILIYGGSFNPPHAGHIRSARTAAETLAPERVLFIPAAIPPHKQLAQGSPAPEHRLAMTALAARSVPGGEALDIELRREGLSYTSDTLRLLRERYPGAELVFLVGTDMLLTLDQWHEPETILSLASIAVFARETDMDGQIRSQAAALREKYGANIYLLEGAPVQISSTRVRDLLPRREGRAYLEEDVYGYIIRHRLYGARPDFDWLRERGYAYLKPSRVAHVQGAEQEARKLAARWGVDVEDAAEAAILHDATKKLSQSEQLRLCEKYGIIVDTVEKDNEKLLHAKTGAALAREEFGVSRQVEEAICWHTTGKPAMTDLERVIYLADYIEPGRSGFSGLEELRTAAYEDLDAAMELGLRMSLAEVRSKGRTPHRDSVTAHAYYLGQLQKKNKTPVPWPGEHGNG